MSWWWVVGWLALWAFLCWAVLPWYKRRSMRKALAAWEVARGRAYLDPKRPKSLQWDPSDPGTNRGYHPGDGPEET